MPEAKADKLWVEATDVMLLMRHVHALGFQPDGCTWQLTKQRGDRAIRGMGSKSLLRLFRSWFLSAMGK